MGFAMRLTLGAVILASYILQSANGTCYYPNGNAATDYNYEPCGSGDTSFQTCCIPEEGDTCLPNGLCSYPKHYYYRSACQNQDGSGCADICPGVKGETWLVINKCVEHEYCCNPDQNKDCCQDENVTRFDLDAQISSSKSTSASPSTTTTESSITATSTSTSTTVPTETEKRASPPEATQDGENKETGGASTSKPVDAIVGGVVGGAAAIAAAGLAIWYFYRRRKDQTPTSESETAAVKSNPWAGQSSINSPHSPYSNMSSPYYYPSNYEVPPPALPTIPVESDSRPIERREMGGSSGIS